MPSTVHPPSDAAFAVFVVATLQLGVACNALTGVDGLRIGDAPEHESAGGDGSEAQGAGAGSVATTGVVGSGATASASSGAGGDSSGTSGPSTAGVGGNSSGSSTGSGPEPPPTDCGAYPTGPYGVALGDVLPPNLSWQGYAPGSDQVTTVVPDDFYDCDGTRGIDAVLLDTSQFG